MQYVRHVKTKTLFLISTTSLISILFSFRQLRARHVMTAAILALVTLVFPDLNTFLQAQWHTDFPRPREHLRVLDGGLIPQRVGAYAGVALHDVQFVAVVIAGCIEPCGVAEAVDVRHKRVAVPVAA